MFSGFDKEKMLNLNANLTEFITLCDKGDLLKEDLDYNHKSLHENIATLIFTKRTPKTIDTIVEATSNVVEYIMANKPKEIVESSGLPNSIISTIMVEKYNERYSDLDESEKEILKALINSDDNKKKEVYSKTIRECIDLIDEKLKESSLEAKDKLLQVKDKLLNDKLEVNEDYTKNISKLVELRSSLKEN